MPKFNLIVEGDYNAETGKRDPDKIKLEGLVWDGDTPPAIVVMPDGLALVKVARYISMPGNNYMYQIASSVTRYVNGQLVEVLAEELSK